MKDVPRIMSTVGGVVLKDDSILYVKQTYGRLADMWTLPWGLIEGQGDQREKIDFPEAAAVREVLEEGNVDASVRGLISFQNCVSQSGQYMLIFVFLCDYIGGTPKPDDRETSDAQFFCLDEIERIEGECDSYCHWMGKRVLQNQYTLLEPMTENPYSPLVGFY